MTTIDKGGKTYWDSVWDEAALSNMADPAVPGIKNVSVRMMAKHLDEAVSGASKKEIDLIEMGCGNSAWLPYFAKHHGFRVTGIDYSEFGCSQERRVLAASGVDGDVKCANFFDPPQDLIEEFDILTSFGVAEHFEPTEDCISAFSRFLRPGGRMITVIPNICGLPGLILQKTNRGLYDKHVPLNPKALEIAHRRAGLNVAYCKPILPVNFYVLTTSDLEPDTLNTKIKDFLFQNAGRASLLIMALSEKLGLELSSKIIAPYIICVADKPQSETDLPPSQ